MPPKPDLNNSLKIENKEKTLAIPPVKAKLLEGKRGLIVGIANENSIAWGCAKAFRAFGAELAVTYLNDKAKKYVEPLARELEAPIVMPLDVRTAGRSRQCSNALPTTGATLILSCTPSRSRQRMRCKAVSPTCRETDFLRPWKCPAGPLSAWHTWQNR